MANPNTSPGGFTPEQQALNAMFEAQEGWGHALGVFTGMVEQTRTVWHVDETIPAESRVAVGSMGTFVSAFSDSTNRDPWVEI